MYCKQLVSVQCGNRVEKDGYCSRCLSQYIERSLALVKERYKSHEYRLSNSRNMFGCRMNM